MIRLHTGRLVDPTNIEKYHFVAGDFIKPLAKINRYTGNTRVPLSVAEHTVKLARSKPVKKAKLSRAAALHDFNEVLTNDLPHPNKKHLPDFVAFEERIQRHLFNVFGEPWENMEALHEYDRRICADEMAQMFEHPVTLALEPLGIECAGWDWKVAEHHLHDLCQEVGVY